MPVCSSYEIAAELLRAAEEEQRQRVDARRGVADARDDGRTAGRDAPGDEGHVRRSHVVHPRAERERTGERAAVEEVASRVDGDVVAPGRQEDAAGRADVEEEVRHRAVRVHRDSGVARDVVLVERAQEPRVDRRVRGEERPNRRVDLQRRSHDDHAGVDGLTREVERVHGLAPVLVDGRIDAEDPEDRERRRRPAVDARAIVALSRVAALELLDRGGANSGQLRPGHRERVRDAPHVRAAPEDDEPEVVAARRSRARAGHHLHDRRATRSDREGRSLDARPCRRDLRPHLDRPRSGTAAGVGDRHRDGAVRGARVHVQVPERERRGIAEDQRLVRARRPDEPGALDEHRRLLAQSRVRERRPGSRHESRLQLLRSPARDGAGGAAPPLPRRAAPRSSCRRARRTGRRRTPEASRRGSASRAP